MKIKKTGYLILSSRANSRGLHARTRSDDYLSQQVFLSNLPRSTRYDLSFLRTYLQDPTSGNHPLLGLDRDVWDCSLNESDLITLSRPINTRHIHSAVNLVGTVISSLFPVLAIVVLYYVQEMPAKLGSIAGFTGLFSFALRLMTHGSRVEIFAATTA